ncbi:hypothetical protein ACHAWO_011614 [Cyclotella atomus]|uniref:Uncharacterized protein n=1 Tax=Cyclotella atomus TaxID=382360 RepID=A0ABD3PFE6_9STRA
MSEEKCMYCLECSPLSPTTQPFSSSTTGTATLISLGCACKGSIGHIHLYCKAKFARFKTFSPSSTPRTREYYWTNCEICSMPLTNLDAVIDLARERHLQCLYHRYDSNVEENDVSKDGFWKELTMSACFFATAVVKKCKNYHVVSGGGGDDDDGKVIEEAVPFWIESCTMMSSTIQLLQQLSESPRQVALLWSADMKFVDCLYYVFQMMLGKVWSLEQNETAYNRAVELVKRYNLRFGSLAMCMIEMKKFAEDISIKTGYKRDKDGGLVLTPDETIQFDQLKAKVVQEMKLANAAAGAERHYFTNQLSCQVEFVNFETYGKHAEKESSK